MVRDGARERGQVRVRGQARDDRAGVRAGVEVVVVGGVEAPPGGVVRAELRLTREGGGGGRGLVEERPRRDGLVHGRGDERGERVGSVERVDRRQREDRRAVRVGAPRRHPRAKSRGGVGITVVRRRRRASGAGAHRPGSPPRARRGERGDARDARRDERTRHATGEAGPASRATRRSAPRRERRAARDGPPRERPPRRGLAVPMKLLARLDLGFRGGPAARSAREDERPRRAPRGGKVQVPPGFSNLPEPSRGEISRRASRSPRALPRLRAFAPPLPLDAHGVRALR